MHERGRVAPTATAGAAKLLIADLEETLPRKILGLTPEPTRAGSAARDYRA
jgi:hypothetical protein